MLAVALAAPQRSLQQSQQETYIVSETPNNNNGIDGYQFGYQLSDGTSRQEQAEVIAARSANEEATLRVRGSYSYYNPYDGQTYTITYIADENGFQPTGAHIPKATL